MNRLRFYIFVLMAGLAATPATLWAQEPDTVTSLPGIEIETAVDRAESYVGDLITYTLTIVYDSSYELIPPPLGANLGAFEVKDYQPDIETTLDDGRLQSQTIFVLSTYTTGDYIIPPLPVFFNLPDSSHKVIMAEPIPITILSLLEMAGADTLDIKPLKPQLSADKIFPPDYRRYYLWGGVGLALLVFGGLAFWWWWRRRKLAGGPEDDREPWEIAFEKLAFVKVEYLEKGIGEQARAKAYYIELTEIIRTYLGRVYEEDVLEMTTEQFLEVFAETELPQGLLEQLTDFFRHADQVKFARFMPQTRRTEDDFLLAHDIVDRVRLDFESRREAETRMVNGDGNLPPEPEEQGVRA